jgi:hypothetical protein
MSLGFEATGDWAPYGSHSVCQSGTLLQASATGSLGLSRRVEQLVGGDTILCVQDTGASDLITMYPSRNGAAPAGQEMFLPDPTYGFYAGVIAYVGDIFDGTTLKQTELENAALTNAYFYHQLYDATQELSFVQGTLNAATLHLRP